MKTNSFIIALLASAFAMTSCMDKDWRAREPHHTASLRQQQPGGWHNNNSC